VELQNRPTVMLVLVVILASAQLYSQGLGVDVHFINDSTRAGMLISVGDSSAVFRFPEYQWDQRSQEVAFTDIKAIGFTHTSPGETSTFTQVAGATGGVIVGAIAGGALGSAITPQAHDFQGLGVIIGATIMGGMVGGYFGAQIVNPSTTAEIRLDPNNREQRDSLRVFLLNQ